MRSKAVAHVAVDKKSDTSTASSSSSVHTKTVKKQNLKKVSKIN